MVLTPKQKAANKAAIRVRDRAFHERYRKWSAARDAAKETREYLAAEAHLEQANAALDRALEARNQRVEQLQAQIEDLKRQIAAVKEDPSIEPLSAARSAAVGARNSLRAALESEVDARFADITAAGPFRCTAASWKIPPEIQAEMEAARAEAEKLFDEAEDGR